MADPFVSISTESAADKASLPVFTEYAYDFDHQCFRYDISGKHITVTENEALKIWIYKALLTERGRYLAYHDDYGITIEPYQGTTPNTVYTADQVRRNIREGLEVNPYIERINSITVEKRERDDLFILVDVTTIYDETSLTVSAGRST